MSIGISLTKGTKWLLTETIDIPGNVVIKAKQIQIYQHISSLAEVVLNMIRHLTCFMLSKESIVWLQEKIISIQNYLLIVRDNLGVLKTNKPTNKTAEKGDLR